MNKFSHCDICPRHCNIDRKSKRGFCGAGDLPRLARAALHMWEEPCISGKRGSGTVFFSGCNLRCVFCQNKEISIGGFGKEVSVNRLSEIFVELRDLGAHNINLVTPTPYIPQIKAAIDMVRKKVDIPFVFNTGGYDSVESIRALDGYTDIFLTDMKYFSSELSAKYSKASDYFEKAIQALRQMLKQVGKPDFSTDGMMRRGVIVRHLVLPNCRKDSINLLDALAAEFPVDSFVLSLMSQYTPPKEQIDEFPELNRRITTFEYTSVLNHALSLGFKGYMQDRSGATSEYTPSFDLSGI